MQKNVQRSIQEGLLNKSKLNVEVVCPELKENMSARCEAKTEDGQMFAVDIDLNEGNLDYKTDGVAFRDQVEDTFAKVYREQYNFSLDSIACPSMVLRGTAAICQGQKDGMTIPIEAMYTVKEGKDDMHFSPKSGLLNTGKLEEFLFNKDKPSNAQLVRVNCGNTKLLVAKPGSTVACSLLGPAGQLGIMDVTLTDEKGAFNYVKR